MSIASVAQAVCLRLIEFVLKFSYVVFSSHYKDINFLWSRISGHPADVCNNSLHTNVNQKTNNTVLILFSCIFKVSYEKDHEKSIDAERVCLLYSFTLLAICVCFI